MTPTTSFGFSTARCSPSSADVDTHAAAASLVSSPILSITDTSTSVLKIGVNWLIPTMKQVFHQIPVLEIFIFLQMLHKV